MAAVQTLKEFCLSIGHDDEEFLAEIDKEEYVSVTISEQEIILTAEEDQRICVKAALGFVDFNQPNALDILKIILEGNFEFSGTRGGTLGVNSSTGEVCFFYQFHCQEVSQAALQQLLVEFAEVGKIWSEALVSFGQGAA